MAENFENIGDSIIDDLLNKVTPEIQDDANYKTKLAAKIYSAMKKKGWNKNEFAKQMNKKNSVITRWLSGYHNFETDTLREIEKKLNISLLNLEEEGAMVVQLTPSSLKGASTGTPYYADYEGARVISSWKAESQKTKAVNHE